MHAQFPFEGRCFQYAARGSHKVLRKYVDHLLAADDGGYRAEEEKEGKYRHGLLVITPRPPERVHAAAAEIKPFDKRHEESESHAQILHIIIGEETHGGRTTDRPSRARFGEGEALFGFPYKKLKTIPKHLSSSLPCIRRASVLWAPIPNI